MARPGAKRPRAILRRRLECILISRIIIPKSRGWAGRSRRARACSLSLIAHLIALVLILLAPRLGLFKSTPIPMQPSGSESDRPIRQHRDATDAPRAADQQAACRRTWIAARATMEKPPQPVDPTPASRGNTSERSVPTPPPDPGRNGDPNPPAPPTPPQPPNATAIPDTVTPARTAGSGLASSLQNMSKYLNNQSFDNPKGGQTDTGADIQFDSKGIDFGPWLARFRAQVMSNWLIPQAAFVQHGHVVFQFWVARDGTISDVHIVDPLQGRRVQHRRARGAHAIESDRAAAEGIPDRQDPLHRHVLLQRGSPSLRRGRCVRAVSSRSSGPRRPARARSASISPRRSTARSSRATRRPSIAAWTSAPTKSPSQSDAAFRTT